jgi:hypothetical protein
LLSCPSVHGFIFFFFVFNDIVSATSHGSLGVGASPTAISAFYIHKLLQRLIEIRRKPSRNAGNRFSIEYCMTTRQKRQRKRKLKKKKKKSETTTEGTAPTERW